MPCYVCAKCECIENTALGHYWSRHRIESFKWNEANEAYKGQPLCSECGPTEYSDDSGLTGMGKWHGEFPKQHWSVHYDKRPEVGFLG